MIKKFIGYYRPHRGLFWADMFFAMLSAGVTLVIPLMIRKITGDYVYRPPEEALRLILTFAAGMAVLIALEAYCNYFTAYYGHVMGAKMEYTMREELFCHYQELSFSFYDNEKVGQLMSRIGNDLFDIAELAHHGPEDLIISIIKLLGSLAIMMAVSWKLAMVALLILPLMILYAGRCNAKMRRAFKQNRIRIADFNAGMEDNLSGIRVVKSFANEDVETDKFRRTNDRLLASKRNAYRCMGVFHSGMGAFTTFITVAVLVAGAIFISRGALGVTDLITFLLYINNFTEPVRKLIAFTEQFQNGATAFSRFQEMMEVPVEIRDLPGAAEPPRFRGEVAFRAVSFHYPDHDKTILSHVSLQVKAGEYIALVGESGAGKSTLCNLIPRFYEVTAGEILIDGTDIRRYTLSGLRNQIGMVQQDVYLFAGTVMENIRYGRPDATEEEIIEAAKKANAHGFIELLPDGYQTDIGQRGIKLSGGQKQRLSIARVFLKNPPILIFDEATSALDNESERVVQESLEKLARNRTTFVIAHRLSTIRNADRILVLTEEGVAEEGTHEQLLRQNGIYAQLYQMQFQ
ncbi:MAG: thiamine ABC transporter permease [Clostridiales bacterium]|nr:MAG: thiamine ABC transporter permease [Clostridiales bacterium]